jgi:hypothetical protein
VLLNLLLDLLLLKDMEQKNLLDLKLDQTQDQLLDQGLLALLVLPYMLVVLLALLTLLLQAINLEMEGPGGACAS